MKHTIKTIKKVFSIRKLISLGLVIILGILTYALGNEKLKDYNNDILSVVANNPLKDAVANLETPTYEQRIWELVKDTGALLAAIISIELFLEFLRKEKAEEETEKRIELITAAHRVAIQSAIEGVHEYGFTKIKNDFEADQLITLIETIKEGQELLIHVTYIRELMDSKPLDAIRKVLKSKDRGSFKIKVLTMDPGSDAVACRADDIEDLSLGESRGEKLKEFKSELNRFITRLKPLQEDPKFEIRLYRDSPGVPFYIVREKKEDAQPNRKPKANVNAPNTTTCKYKPIKAITGFYLDKPFPKTLHLEWEAGVKDDGGFLKYLDNFFENKWRKWEKSDLPHLEGYWQYEMTAIDESEDTKNDEAIEHRWKTAFGFCEIQQDGKKLFFKGARTKEDDRSLLKNEVDHKVVDDRVPWSSNWAAIAQKDDYNTACGHEIRMEYNIKSKTQRNSSLLSYCKLDEIEQTNTIIKGKYFILEKPEKNDLYFSTCGKITFTKLDVTSNEQISGISNMLNKYFPPNCL